MLFPPRRTSPWLEYGLALAIFGVVSLVNLWLERWIGYEAIALVYLLAVVLLALFVGRGPILFGTILTAVGWSVVFAPPRFSFQIGSFYDKMMFGMYFVVALTVGQLTAQLRAERLAEHKREERSRALYWFTRELANAADRMDILHRLLSQVREVVEAESAHVFPADPPGGALKLADAGSLAVETQLALATQAHQQNRIVVDRNPPPPNSAVLYLPLTAGGPSEGVLAVRFKTSQALDADRQDLLENFARQAALVLDRQRLRDAETRSRLLIESERLGRTLLNSVSHELRTPLAAIATAAATLRDSGGLSPIQQKLSSEIDFATIRLNRVVQSLLSAARIQSGQVRPHLDWCDLSEVVRTTLRELSPLLARHQTQTRLEAPVPLIRADFILLQQALGNLLVNAATYSPPGTLIEIMARAAGGELVLEVADGGPGLPADQLERVFDRFHRPPGSKPGGTGLGLTIVRGFVEAQGGRVLAQNRPEGGARFSIYLPVQEAPKISEEPSEN